MTQRYRPFLILACFFALLGGLLLLSEHYRWNFAHPSWRLRQLGTLLDDAQARPTGVLFLGASRMMAAVQPRVVEETYASVRGGETLRARNFGLEKGDWENAYLLLQRHLREAGAPEMVVIETGQMDLTREAHRLLRNLASPADLRVLWPDWPMRDSLELSLAVMGRGPLDLVHRLLVPADDVTTTLAHGGHKEYEGTIVENQPQMWARLQKLDLHELLAKRGQASYRKEENVGLLQRYLPRIRALCDAADSKLYVLQVPQLYETRLSPGQLEVIGQHAEVLEPFHPEFYSPDCYAEVRHLNGKGSTIFSQQVGRLLAGSRLPDLAEWLRQENR